MRQKQLSGNNLCFFGLPLNCTVRKISRSLPQSSSETLTRTQGVLLQLSKILPPANSPFTHNKQTLSELDTSDSAHSNWCKRGTVGTNTVYCKCNCKCAYAGMYWNDFIHCQIGMCPSLPVI